MASDDLSIWVVYDHPSDFPNFFVARRHEITGKGSTPTPDTLQTSTLDEMRNTFRRSGLTCLMRHPEDDAKIVETWL